MDRRERPLTKRRQSILDTIIEYRDAHGYPPTVREIGAAVGLRSAAAVKAHLDVLQEDGYIKVARARPRCIEVLHNPGNRCEAVYVPGLAGGGAAPETLMPVPRPLAGDGELFMVQMSNDTLIGAGILAGDYVVCRRGAAAAGSLAAVTADDGSVTIVRLPTRVNGRRPRVRGAVVTVMRGV